MRTSNHFIKPAVAAATDRFATLAVNATICCALAVGVALIGSNAVAEPDFDRSGELMQQLRDADAAQASQIERELNLMWRNSGSATADLLLTRAKDALEAGETSKAIGHLSALLDHTPDFAQARYLRAMAFFKQGEYGLASSDLGQALTLNPNHFNALLGQAVILETLGNDLAAFRAYSRVLDMYPAHERAQKGADRLRVVATGQDI